MDGLGLPNASIHTDAIGTLGYGGILGNKMVPGSVGDSPAANAPGISIA